VTLWLVEALVVMSVLLGNLLKFAAVAHCASSEGIGNSSNKQASNHPEELHVAQQIHLLRKWLSQQAS